MLKSTISTRTQGNKQEREKEHKYYRQIRLYCGALVRIEKLLWKTQGLFQQSVDQEKNPTIFIYFILQFVNILASKVTNQILSTYCIQKSIAFFLIISSTKFPCFYNVYTSFKKQFESYSPKTNDTDTLFMEIQAFKV